MIKKHKPNRLPVFLIILNPTTVWKALGIYLPYAVSLPCAIKSWLQRGILLQRKTPSPPYTHSSTPIPHPSGLDTNKLCFFGISFFLALKIKNVLAIKMTVETLKKKKSLFWDIPFNPLLITFFCLNKGIEFEESNVRTVQKNKSHLWVML